MTATRVLLAVAVLGVVACGPPPRGDDHGGDGGSGDDGGGSCAQTCSSDLHDVLDCMGNVVQTCAADQGCGMNGQSLGCVQACQSAADNKSTIGCDYYAVDPEIISAGAGACFAAFIANTWGYPISLTVERDGQTFPLAGYARIPSGQGMNLTYAPLQNGMLDPNQVAILFLARFGGTLTNCPAGITPAYTTTDAAVH